MPAQSNHDENHKSSPRYRPPKDVSLASQVLWDPNTRLGEPMTLSTIRRWHPKITPYRFIVFMTTIVIGTTKLRVTLSGDSTTPTTLEWVGGTVLSILFFSVSGYDISSADHRSAPPSWLKWLFVWDCMDAIWSLFSIFSIPRPRYNSDEKVPTLALSSYPQPPITGYRLLVCTVVIAFSIAKAVLNYQNVSSPIAPWLDWALAVPLFSILYCLGLYEYNTAGIWASFFIVDRSDMLYSLKTVTVYLVALSFCAAWMHTLHYTTTLVSYHPSLLSELRENGMNSSTLFCKLLAHEFLLAGIITGALTAILIVRKALLRTLNMRSAIFSRIRQMKSSATDNGRYNGYEMARPVDETQTSDHGFTEHRFYYFDLALEIIIHLLTYMFGSAVYLTLAFALGSPFFLLDGLTGTISGNIFVGLTVWISRVCLLLFSAAFIFSLVVYGAMMTVWMVEPLFYVFSHGTGKPLGEKLEGKLLGFGPLERLL